MNKEFIRIDINKENVKALFQSFNFREGDFEVVYVPSLKISGYGDTHEEAIMLLKINISEFFDSLLSLDENKIYSHLKELGWKRNKFLRKRLNSLSETTYEDIKKEFNIPDDIHISKMPLAV